MITTQCYACDITVLVHDEEEGKRNYCVVCKPLTDRRSVHACTHCGEPASIMTGVKQCVPTTKGYVYTYMCLSGVCKERVYSLFSAKPTHEGRVFRVRYKRSK